MTEQAADTLWNRDLAPTDAAQRTWAWYHYAALWVGMMIALTVVNYGFPIAQLASVKETSVPAVHVGRP